MLPALRLEAFPGKPEHEERVRPPVGEEGPAPGADVALTPVGICGCCDGGGGGGGGGDVGDPTMRDVSGWGLL
ncbi:hypothetical protein TOPH_04501 [Tolypocladium ophioglossoides CBS 100239]|uniref:Uncharacterized protein n=1 Tax=Tolypocladium ophioglossoides (strain CBS 100239) TaxID=1163406 RepID=A0A0L0NA10_TOLOC|nr:hypothetical protein TOPH_04501 [Tolypocladium ophioglossoides CBS 100239]